MRPAGVLIAALLSSILAGCWGDSTPEPTRGEPLASAPVYSSVDGELHLRVTADTAGSEIAGVPYKHMDIYKTEIVGGKGRSSDGSTSTYVGAQWSVKPGDTLTIDYVNKLDDAQFAPIGSKGDEPTPQPLNLHTHGLTVSPSGNSDNVLLSIPQGRSNRFTIKSPRTSTTGCTGITRTSTASPTSRCTWGSPGTSSWAARTATTSSSTGSRCTR